MPNKEPRGKHRPRVAITVGDINGIGPEVILKCLADHRIFRFFVPVVVGSISTLRTHAEMLGMTDVDFRVVFHPMSASHQPVPSYWT